MDQMAALSSKVAELDKVQAVMVSELKTHREHDSERFDAFVQTAKDINSKMDNLMMRVEKGVTRAHDRIDEVNTRIDEQVVARTNAMSAMKTDMQKGISQTKIWVLTGALTVTLTMAWYFFTDRMEEAKRYTPTAISGAQAADQTQN